MTTLSARSLHAPSSPRTPASASAHVDFLPRRLTIAESATEVGGTVEFGSPKTHQQRTVPFPVALAEPLARRCDGKAPTTS